MTVSHARCRLCSEEISFTVGNPVELGFHMIDRHSSGSVVQYSIHEECPSRKPSNLPPCQSAPIPPIPSCASPPPCALPPSPQGSFSRNAVPCDARRRGSSGGGRGSGGGGGGWGSIRNFGGKECPGAAAKRRRKKTKGLYKTTLETWTAGKCLVMCPGCKKEVKPLVRSQRNKVAYTSLGAAFLLSCWPFCFLCPIQHKCTVDLYCPGCKTKLGVYDTERNIYHTRTGVLPNINSAGCC